MKGIRVLAVSGLVLAFASGAFADPITLGTWASDYGAPAPSLSNDTGSGLTWGGTNSSSNTAIVDSFAAQTLSNVGDTITFSGKVNFSGITAPTGGDQFRVALLNHNTNTGLASATGFLGYWQGAQTKGNAANSSFKKITAANAWYSGSNTTIGTFAQFPTGTGDTWTNTDTYDFTLTLTKVAGGLSYAGLLVCEGDGFQLFNVTGTDTAATNFTFDRVGFLEGGSMGATSVALSNMQVTLTPEPATMTLLGLGAVGLLRRRRK